MPHLKMWEIMQRAAEGPFCEDDTFLYEVFLPTMKQVLRKYEIRFDPASPVPADDDLADRVWRGRRRAVPRGRRAQRRHAAAHHDQRGRAERGALPRAPSSTSSGRATRRAGGGRVVSRTSARRSASSAPTSPTTRTSSCRPRWPTCRSLWPTVCAVLSSRRASARNIVSGTPSEMAGVMEHAMLLRNAAKLVGRPGLFLVAVGTAQSDTGQVAVSNDEWGVRASDGRLIGVLTEMKTDNELLNKVAHCKQYGCAIGCLTGAIYGGYAGGAEGTAVLETAHHLVGLTVYQHNFNNSFPFHLQYTSNSGREMLWVVSMVHQALARNSRILSTSQRLLQRRTGDRHAPLRSGRARHRQHRVRRRPVDGGAAAQQVPQLRDAARGASRLRGRPRCGAAGDDARAGQRDRRTSSSASTRRRSPTPRPASPSRSATTS